MAARSEATGGHSVYAGLSTRCEATYKCTLLFVQGLQGSTGGCGLLEVGVASPHWLEPPLFQ